MLSHPHPCCWLAAKRPTKTSFSAMLSMYIRHGSCILKEVLQG